MVLFMKADLLSIRPTLDQTIHITSAYRLSVISIRHILLKGSSSLSALLGNLRNIKYLLKMLSGIDT